MNTYHTKGTCALEEWISIRDDFVLAVQTHIKRNRRFPRTVFVTRDSVEIKRGDLEDKLQPGDCRWWLRSVGEDWDISLTIPVPAIVMEFRTGWNRSHKITFALHETARKECAAVLKSCGVIHQIPACRRVSRHVGWLVGAVIAIIQCGIGCLIWNWTVPANRPLDHNAVARQFVAWEIMSVLFCGVQLSLRERFYTRKIDLAEILLLMKPSIMTGIAVGAFASRWHVVACSLISLVSQVCCLHWAISEERTPLTEHPVGTCPKTENASSDFVGT